jgi:exonuclease III
VVYWNIDGLTYSQGGALYNKLNQPHVQEALNAASCGLLGVAELKLPSAMAPGPVEGFTLLHHVTCSRARTGGLAVYARAAVAPMFTVVASCGNDGYIAVQCPSGLIVVFLYFPPEASPVYQHPAAVDPLDVVQHLLDMLRPKGQLVLMGDYNARCGQLDDRTNGAVDELVEQLGVDSDVQRAYRADLPLRSSSDTGTNSRGKDLVTLMQVEDLVLLNGRVPGCNNAGYTCQQKRGRGGSSVVDLCIMPSVTYELLHTVSQLDVGFPHADGQVGDGVGGLSESDHYPLVLRLPHTHGDNSTSGTVDGGTQPPASACDPWGQHEDGEYLPEDWYDLVMGSPLPAKPIWDASCSAELATNLTNAMPALDAVLDCQDVQQAVTTLQQCLQQAVGMSMPWVQGPKQPSGRLTPLERLAHVDWYTRELSQLRNHMDQLRASQGVTSAAYTQASRVYKSRCRAARQAAHSKLMTNVRSSLRTDAKGFWKQYLSSKRRTCAQPRSPSLQSWAEYGRQLYDAPPDMPIPAGLQDPVEGVDTGRAQELLDAECSVDEMGAALSHLKQGKAEDVHGLRAEHLKVLCSHIRTPSGMLVKKYTLEKHLAHIFNLCMSSGTWPADLCIGRVCPIHKKGDPEVHDHYRCITVEAVLAKLFGIILQRRAADYLEQQRLRAPEQSGFRRQRSCRDQLFTLNHVLRSCKQGRQRVFATFVDFRKAFDSLPRPLLMARLRQLGFTEKYLHVLQSMFAQARMSFGVHGGLSEPVDCRVGVLQGDPLSPTLFGVFIDCIMTYMRARCPNAKVPTVHERLLYGLLYADDLVLLSLDQPSAQQQLDALHDFCSEYGLTVNIAKSATVVFNASKAFSGGVQLSFGDQAWPIQDEYRYLGLVVSRTQGVAASAATLELAGKRAAVWVLQRCREMQITDLGLAMHLFNAQVLPCITYGAEVWLPYMTCIMADPSKGMQAPMERVQLWFLKRFLRLRGSTPSWVLLAECSRAPVYLYALKQVCRYWNHLVQQDESHLARDVFLDSVQAAQAGVESWAGKVLDVLHRVGACVDPRWLLLGATPLTPAQTTFDTSAVHSAFDDGLENLWQVWQSSTRYTLRVYATVFKCRRHLNWEDNYMRKACMPYSSERQLLLFRCFNAQLNKHTSNWEVKAGRGQAPNRALCGCCDMGEVEDEAHVLHDCPRYQPLRGRYQVPMVPQVHRFLPATAHAMGGFVKAALQLRQQPLAADREA